ncbi:RNA pseudouridine synthase [Methylophaga sp. 42_25_T18]|nr:RNA pseudouridine synthase [Methylophaga sp. 42_25_T18]OUR87507.1 RNA pseudouridine synthase [Methylophaga sp. 42_8_T64]
MSNNPSQFEKHINISSNDHLAVDLLASETGLSKQQVKSIMQKGAVWVTRGKKILRLRRAKKPLRTGETVHIYYDSHVLDMLPPEPELVMDVGQYSIWNKPYGMLSQGSKWGDHCTITRWAEQHLTPQRPSFVVHRLDRAANGLIIVAHEKRAAAALSELFQKRKVDKRYQIWVHGRFDTQATAENPTRIESDIDGRHAVSYFTLVEYDEEYDRSLLDVTIETGRKHQIRRHSAELGFPVIGDRLHGIEGDKQDLQLTAYYLSFKCPFSHRQRSFNLLP